MYAIIEHLTDLVSGLGSWAYLIIFLGVCLESAALLGFFMPGETLTVLGGFLASQGILDLATLIVLVSVAAVLGDSIGYELGRHFGRPWLLRVGRRFGLHDHYFNHVDQFFQRHGGKTVFLARFSALFRIMVPFFAGASRLPYREFLVYNVAGGVLWATASVLLGYFAGESWEVAEHWIGRAGALAVLVIAVVLAFAWFWRWRLRKT